MLPPIDEFATVGVEMEPLLQLFEFSYPDGYLFLDRAGAACRRLREWTSGLDVRAVESMQVEMQMPEKDLELYFGIRTSAIQSTSAGKRDFASLAAGFVSTLVNTFELSTFESFRFRQVIGRPCTSIDEAVSLIRPLVSENAGAKLGKLAPETQWRSVQAEYVQNNLMFQNRIAVVDMPNRSTGLNEAVPHITVQLDIRGLVPVPVSDIDVRMLVQNVAQHHLDDVISKIAPHLSPV